MPAVVGTGNATEILRDGAAVTVSCTEGSRGKAYAGRLPYEETSVGGIQAFRVQQGHGVNLDLVGDDELQAGQAHAVRPVRRIPLVADARGAIDQLTEGYLDRGRYFTERLAYGIARIAASRWPDPVVVRTSDFKTNEYAKLLGGRPFEPVEANPMSGWRGASRYYSDGYSNARPCAGCARRWA
ncbi:putative PEP-binding protein [Streptomyces lavendulae]|uniref:putative PEP-binding protein n=1 Tax=Streptomyces lavendulae TaxID=1914 RepID=UPI0024A49039|nr:putative PEP-binding protein [Streptomyces lavendulae]GLX25236.1 hypothetical protein Slala02_10560 [Streptomyces lavendulae subsp. lavendulae]